MLHKERGGRQKWNNNAFDSIYQKDYCESLLLVEEKVVDLFFTNPCVFCYIAVLRSQMLLLRL